MLAALVIIAVIGLAIAGYLHFTKAGQADVAALEARIQALENLFTRGLAQATAQKAPSPQPVPSPTPIKPTA